jgi:glycosyltransferase involved in cell wall biosynthesis
MNFFRYAHHVATSDHAGDVLKRIYMIPEERVHIILNGVDEEIFKPDVTKGNEFKQKFGIPASKLLVLGTAGRLVKDKGHPLMFEALREMFKENETFRETSAVLVAGDGPWAVRYRDLGVNVLVLGPLEQAQLARFYNAIDIFVNPTLRAQGLDHTLLEAMLSGKPVMATKLASITGSVLVGTEIGYTFTELGLMAEEFWRTKVRLLSREVWSCSLPPRWLLHMRGYSSAYLMVGTKVTIIVNTTLHSIKKGTQHTTNGGGLVVKA